MTITQTMTQAKSASSTVDGTDIDYDIPTILTLVEEDGELKISEFKDFSDPKKRSNLFSWAAKALAKGVPAA